jgi:cell division protease FtsH
MDNEKNTPKKPIDDRPGKGPLPKKGSAFNRGPISWLVIFLVIMTIMMMFNKMKGSEEINYSPEFLNYVKAGHVKSVKIHDYKIIGEFNADGVTARGADSPVSFKVNYNPPMHSEELLKLLGRYGVEVTGTEPSPWASIIGGLLPILFLVGIIYFVFIRNMKSGGGGMLMNFGRSKHKLRGKEQNVTFDDVAGIEEAKEEVSETIEFLRNPKKFHKIGGRIPRGVLLIGPPGCGKTLLAKAIAGESDVPFFSISGSDFVEMFVGVGASRVRDLFKQAKENSPCIIFLDEIDAIGRKRGSGFASGGHDEREQTLNAILVEMDGFDTNDQVIVMAATNRADILDHALTRPGRFDRQVVVPLPDLTGRLKILKIHARKVKIADEVNFERIARGTPMFSGAELEALINEAAISASMAEKDFVEMADLEEARDKVRWGRARKSRVVDEDDKKLTAYHEAGHAFVQYSLKDADPLHKVSIIPRGPFGGATFSLPEKDRMYYKKNYCIAHLQICFAGRIAEEVFCDDITSGAQSDIRSATAMAKEMILTWGMGDELGPIDYSGAGNAEMYFPSSTPDYSEKTSELIDKEVHGLIDENYKLAKDLIELHKDQVKALAMALIKYETLDAEDVKVILEGRTLDKPTVTDLLAAEQKRSEAEAKKKGEADTAAAQDRENDPMDPPTDEPEKTE